MWCVCVRARFSVVYGVCVSVLCVCGVCDVCA
jgi:hypothetical protein